MACERSEIPNFETNKLRCGGLKNDSWTFKPSESTDDKYGKPFILLRNLN